MIHLKIGQIKIININMHYHAKSKWLKVCPLKWRFLLETRFADSGGDSHESLLPHPTKGTRSWEQGQCQKFSLRLESLHLGRLHTHPLMSASDWLQFFKIFSLLGRSGKEWWGVTATFQQKWRVTCYYPGTYSCHKTTWHGLFVSYSDLPQAVNVVY